MEDIERDEVEEFLPQAIDFLERQSIGRYLSTPEGEIVMDRAWEIAAMLRLAYIRGCIDKRDRATKHVPQRRSHL
jgi:hypothetical protein